jgi:hypothetical protein
MDRADPIRRVSAVSTGQVQIRLDQLAQATGQVPTLATV